MEEDVDECFILLFESMLAYLSLLEEAVELAITALVLKRLLIGYVEEEEDEDED